MQQSDDPYTGSKRQLAGVFGFQRHFYSEVRTVYIPASVTDISLNALRNSSVRNLYVHQDSPVYSSAKGILYSRDGSSLLLCPPVGHSTVKIPDGVTSIGDHAFYESSLTAVTLPETLISIGSHAFAGTGIQELVIPASVTAIGERAFSDCGELYKVTVNGSPNHVGDYAFANCNPFMACSGPVEDCPIHTALAHYWYNVFTLTLNAYTGTKTSTVPAGTELLLSTAPETAENTEFTGWYTDENCTAQFTDTVMPAADLTLWQGSREIFRYETLSYEETGEEGTGEESPGENTEANTGESTEAGTGESANVSTGESTGTGAEENSGQTGSETETPAVTVRITGCTSSAAEVTIPGTLFDIPVTAIAAGSFSSAYTQVTIPASI